MADATAPGPHPRPPREAVAWRVSDEPLVAWKRAQVLVRPPGGGAGAEVRFAGPVRSERPYRADDVFWCPAGHRRLEPACTCGFYAVAARAALPASVVVTAVVEVALEGRVVRHPACLRAERQVVRAVHLDPWCSFCVAPTAVVGGVASTWDDLPAGWLRGVPMCAAHGRLAATVLSPAHLAEATEAEVRWDDVAESRAARSLRRFRRPPRIVR